MQNIDDHSGYLYYSNCVSILFRAGTFGAIVEYGCEKKISRFSHLGATMIIGVPIGVTVKIKYVKGVVIELNTCTKL